MPITRAPAAKLAVITALKDEAASGRLGDVEVHYAAPGELPMRCVYGGGWRMQQAHDAPEEPGLLVREVVSVSLYARVLKRPPCPVEETDADAWAIANLIGKVFAARPQLAGGLSWLGIESGQGDYSATGVETISIHAYQVLVGSRFGWAQE